MYTHTRKCCGDIFLVYVAATRPIVSTDGIIIVKHQFGSNFVPASCCKKFNLLNFMRLVAGTKRCSDAITFRVHGAATCPLREVRI
jgi:hypothetical protein